MNTKKVYLSSKQELYKYFYVIITKLSDGFYLLLRNKKTGKNVLKKKLYVENRDEADKKSDEIIQRIYTTLFIESKLTEFELVKTVSNLKGNDDITIDEFISAIMKEIEKEVKLKKIRNSTFIMYKKLLPRFRDTMKNYKRINEITTDVLEEYKIKRFNEIQDYTLHVQLVYLRAFFRRGLVKGLIKYNPFDEINIKKRYDLPAPTIIPDEHFKMIINQCNKNPDKVYAKFRDCIIFCRLTGARISEMSNVQVKDIDFEKRGLKIDAFKAKGKKQRIIVLHDELYTFLKKKIDEISLINSSDDIEELFVFGNKNKKYRKPYNPITVSVSFRKCCRELKLYQRYKYHFHHLRGSYATAVLKMTGGDIYTTANVLGHSDYKITERYLNVENSHVQKLFKKWKKVL